MAIHGCDEAQMKAMTGRYALKRHGTYDASGFFVPTSDFISGELIYAADGSMSVLICFKAEPEKLSDLLAYSGRFETIGEKNLHHIHVCSQPSRAGKTEEREFELRGDKLFLRAPVCEGGLFEAEWERAPRTHR